MNQSLIIILFKRIFQSVIVILVLSFFSFLLIHVSPGDPTIKYVSPSFSPELSQNVTENFKLNSSFFSKLYYYTSNIMKGDFGVSFNYHQPTFKVIVNYLSFTLILAFLSFLLELIITFFLVQQSLAKKKSFFIKILDKTLLGIYSTPSFVSAVLLIYLFSYLLGILPSSGISYFDATNQNLVEKILDYTVHLILPVLNIAVIGLPMLYKYLRDNLDYVYNQNFIKYLYSQGISEKKIIKSHIIPNSVGPLIAFAGVELGNLLTGSLITEVIFNLPGIGKLTLTSILTRDYPMVVGCCFTITVLVILANLLADITRAVVDKRLIKEVLN